MITTRSPKNKFRASVTFEKPIKEIGSCVSYGAMSIELLKSIVMDEVKRIGVSAHIQIKENKQTYPKFEWVVVENYGIEL